MKTGKPRLLINAPYYFHYLHVEPLLDFFCRENRVDTYVVVGSDFPEINKVKNINYVSEMDFSRNVLGSFDYLLATEFSSLPYWFDQGVISFFLLHGVGPKKTYIQNKMIGNFDYLLCPGPSIYKIQSEVINEERILKTGLPITDYLVHDRFDRIDLGFPDEGKPVLLYAPSWSVRPELISMDIDILDRLSSQDICNVVVKPHPLILSSDSCGGMDWKGVLQRYEGPGFKVFYDKNYSIYKMFNVCDCLMSDISSVVYEFMIIGKPVILYSKPELFSWYQAEDEYRSLMMSSYKLTSPGDLDDVLEKVFKGDDEMRDQRKKLVGETFFNIGKSAYSTYVEMMKVIKRYD